MTLKLEESVHKVVVGSWTNPQDGGTYQQMLSVPCTNLSIVGEGKGKTTVHVVVLLWRVAIIVGTKVEITPK